ncbi:MAG: hypothetical protein QXK37_06410 [Candidatus Woesearchaeota archaeon]
MKYLIITPAVAVLVLSFASQMAAIAENSTQKVASYADDMNNALDCAFKGVDLRVCSPELYNYNFDEDINSTVQTVEKFTSQKRIKYAIEDYDGNMIIVID